jgi:hypothetical protein
VSEVALLLLDGERVSGLVAVRDFLKFQIKVSNTVGGAQIRITNQDPDAIQGGVSRMQCRQSGDPRPTNGRPISLDADSVHHDLL